MSSNETLDTPDPANIDGSSGAAGTEFSDNVFRIIDNADPTRKLAFNLGNVTSGTTRTFVVPDNDAVLGRTDFPDNIFRISDESDDTKKISFQASGITSGQVRTITMPDTDVDLGNITGATEFDDDVFRIKDNADDTKKVAFEVSSITTSTTRTIIVPDSNIDLSDVGKVDFEDATFRISDDIDNTKKIAFQASGISTGTVRTITMPDTDVDLGNVTGQTEFSDSNFRIQDNADATKEIAFEASGITTGTVRTITMPDADVDLGLIGGSEFSDSVLRIVDNGDNTKKLAFEVSNITTGTTRTITMPDSNIDLSDVGNADFTDDTFRVSDDGDNTKKIAFEASAITTSTTRTITFVDSDVILGQTDFEDDSFRISDQGDNTKKIAFEASAITTSTTRTITMPDSNVDLTDVGNTDFEDNVFRISDNTDNTKKIAFEASAINTGTVRTITMPDADVDLSLVGGSELSDATFRVVDDGDASKKIAFEASGITTSNTRTITMPDADVDLSDVGKVDFTDDTFRISDNGDSTKKIAFEVSAISTSTVRTITMPDTNVDLTNAGPDIPDNVFRISDNGDNTKKIAFEASAINTGTVRTITMPDSDVDLGLIGGTELSDATFRVVDDGDNTKKIAFEASAITTSTVRTITMPDADVDLGLVGGSEFSDATLRVVDNGDNTKKLAFEVSSVATSTTRTITMPDSDVDLSLVGTTEFSDATLRIVDNGDNTKKVAFEVSSITTSTTRTITMPDRAVDLERLYVLPDPTVSSDPANKNYIDTQIQGPADTIFGGDVETEDIAEVSAFVFDTDTTIRLATTSSIASVSYSTGTLATLSSTTTGTLSIDSVAVAVGDVVLIKDQSTLAQNGVYKVVHIGSGSTGWVLIKMHPNTLGSDYENDLISPAISAGSTNSNKRFALNTPSGSLAASPTIDYSTEDQVWEEFGFIENNSVSDIDLKTEWVSRDGGFDYVVSVVKTKTAPGEEFVDINDYVGFEFLNLGVIINGAKLSVGGSTIGGVSVSEGDFILVDQQTSKNQNGIYRIFNADAGSWVLTKAFNNNVFGSGLGSGDDIVDYRNGMIVEVDSGSGSTFSGNKYILNTPSADLTDSPTIYYLNDGTNTSYAEYSAPLNTDPLVWELWEFNEANVEEVTNIFLSDSLSDAATKTASSLTATYTGTNPAVLVPNSNGAIGSIGGITPSLRDQILITEQGTASENGLYQVLFAGGANNPYVLGKKHSVSAGADYINGQFVNITSGTFSGEDHMLSTSVGSLASPPTVDYSTGDQTWQEYTTAIKNNLQGLSKVGENSVSLNKIFIENSNDLEIFAGGTIGQDSFTKIVNIDENGLDILSGTLNTSSFSLTGDIITTSGNLILTSGNVGIKESSPEGELHATETSGDTDLILENQSTTASNSGKITFRKNRSDDVITAGDLLGAISATGYDGSSDIEAAKIEFDTFSPGTIDLERIPGIIKFSTHPDSTSSITERMRINPDGFIGINENTPEQRLHITGGSTPTIIIESQSNTATDSSRVSLRRNRNSATINSGDQLGRIVFEGYDGSNNIDAARIVVNSTGTIATNRVGGIMKFQTHPDSTSQPSDRMIINEDGYVGINEGSPQSLLHVSNTSGNIEVIIQSSTTGTSKLSLGDTDDIDIGNILYDNTNNYMAFTTNTSEVFRINSSGNVGINETDPDEKLHVTDNQATILIESQSTTATDNATLLFLRNRSDGVITSGDNLGAITVQGNDGSSNLEVAQILFDSTGTIGTNSIGGQIKFFTHPDSASSIVQRMIIKEDGYVGIGETNPTSLLHVSNDSGNAEIIIQADNSSNSKLSFGDTDDTDIGNIIYGHGSDAMSFTVNTNEGMRLTSTGLGINELAPEGELHITESTSNTRVIIENQSTTATTSGRLIFLRNRSDGAVSAGDCTGQINFQAEDTAGSNITVAQINVDVPSSATIGTNQVAGDIIFQTHPNSTSPLEERMRISHEGYVGINEDDPEELLHITQTSTSTVVLLQTDSATTTDRSEIKLRRNRGGGAITSGDNLGKIVAEGYEGTNNIEAASIKFDSTGTIGTDRIPGIMKFFTHPDSTSASEERMRIDENGGVNIGGASNADESAILEVESTDRGVLLPKMTTTQRNNISSPKNGLVIFNSSTQKLQVYANNSWANLN